MAPAPGYKVTYIGMIYPELDEKGTSSSRELVKVTDLNEYSRFTRAKQSVDEFLTLFSLTIAERTEQGSPQSVKQDNYRIHAIRVSDDLCGIMVTEFKYDHTLAHKRLGSVIADFVARYPLSSIKSTTNFKLDRLNQDIIEFQKPESLDEQDKIIMDIQTELAGAEIALKGAVDNVLKRGENIDELVKKSDHLGFQSQFFYREAKKQNNCCTVM